MHSIHAILVNITDAIRNDEKKITEMTKEELKERVINYAENHTDSFSIVCNVAKYCSLMTGRVSSPRTQ